MKNILLLYIGLFISGLNVAFAASGIYFNRLNVNHGLSSNEVTCIYKDKKGFMWFGINGELNRFDGYEFKSFKHRVNGLPYSKEVVSKIIETLDGNLWITYQNESISMYNPGEDKFYTQEEAFRMIGFQDAVYNVYGSRDHQLIFTTRNDHNMYGYNYKSDEIFEIPVDTTEGAVSDVYSYKESLYIIYSSGVVDIIQLLPYKRVARIKPFDRQLTSDKYRLFVDEDEDVWVYMGSKNSVGLYRYNRQSGDWDHYHTRSQPALNSQLVTSMVSGPDKKIWIGTDHGGINIFDKRTNRIEYLKNDPFDHRSLSQNSIISLYRDDTGIIWAGTFKEALNYYHESIIKFDGIRYPVQTMDEVEMNDCNSVIEDKNGNLWIGTDGNGLLCYNPSSKTYKVYKHNPADPNSISSDIIISMAFDEQDNLWIGSYIGGLDCFDGNRIVRYPNANRQHDGSAQNSVYTIYPDKKGLIWAGTLGNGLQCLNLKTGEWKFFCNEDQDGPLASNFIYSISPGKDGEIYLGTSYGASVINTDTYEIYDLQTKGSDANPWYADKMINAIYRDSHNLLWICTNTGIYIYDYKHDKEYLLDKENGLKDDQILSIIEDDNYTLWLGSKKGMIQIMPHMREENTYHFTCSTYDESEGVQGKIFNRNSVCRTEKGDFIFGGTNGLTAFNPLTIKYNHNIPEVVITDFTCINSDTCRMESAISYVDDLVLNYNQRNFSLTLSAFNYFLPHKNKFSYKLEGYDKDWITLDSPVRTITYADLSPGKYTFMAIVENNDGVISKTPLMLPVTIRPPFWRTNWAIALYCLLTVSFLYLIIYLITKWQRRKFLREQKAALTEQLHKMDEMKLRFFTNVSHEFRTPLTLIITPVEQLLKETKDPEDQKMLQIVHQHARQLLNLVNQLLDFRKIDVQKLELLVSSGDIVLFVKNITFAFKALAAQKQIQFDFHSEMPSKVMQFDSDKVYKIVSNLLSNAFKFTGEGGQIAVEMGLTADAEQQQQLFIRIKDSGIGIEKDKQQRVFDRFYQVTTQDASLRSSGTGIGLHLCQEFVKLHHGTITLESEPGKGSTFTVILPVNQQEEVVIEQNMPDYENLNMGMEATMPVHEEDEEVEKSGINEKPVLVLVDDNADFREFMILSLKKQYHIYTAANGEEALTLIRKELPDMVISDVMMPVMDGIELCKLIKQDLRTSHIPVILLTAKSAEQSKMSGLEAGADDYIGKPFNMDLLQMKIQQLLETRQKMQQQFMNQAKSGIVLTAVTVDSMDKTLMEKAIRFIEEEIANPELSVERLSREMGMSRVNFYKKTLSITGKSPVELIRIVRLKRAARLLLRGEKRISEVAFECGFNDNKLFRKYFKEEYGVLPSEYSEQQEGINLKD